jgi:hypothetical protein
MCDVLSNDDVITTQNHMHKANRRKHRTSACCGLDRPLKVLELPYISATVVSKPACN